MESPILKEIRELGSMPRLWNTASTADFAAASEYASETVEQPPPPTEPAPDSWPFSPQGTVEEAEEPGTLSPGILHYFASLDLTPISGVNDPALKEKLANPSAHGWLPRTHLVSTFRSTVDPTPSAMHYFRLTPCDGKLLGQMVMLSEDGDVFLETTGPWGRTWMYRSPAGEVSCRELRTAPVPERLHFRKTA